MSGYQQYSDLVRSLSGRLRTNMRDSLKGPLSLYNFEGSGADWLERYKQYIEDGETVVASPHKVYGSENNDLSLQLRKGGIDKIILAGISAIFVLSRIYVSP